MSYTSEVNPAPNAAELHLPKQKMEDVFWLNPAAIEDVDGLVNETHLSTMTLGVGTLSDAMPQARDELSHILIESDDPRQGALQRALDVGYMYGSLIAKKTAELSDSGLPHMLSATISRELGDGLAHAVAGLDLHDTKDSFEFFRRLRNLEVELCKSDVLAVGLSMTEDHMYQEFEAAAHTVDDVEPTREMVRRKQSLYYAGALVGALLNSDQERLDKPKIEIMPAPDLRESSIAMHLQFESSDNFLDTIDVALRSKLAFTYVDDEDQPYVAAYPNITQHGPNSLSLPVYMAGIEQPKILTEIPVENMDGLLVQNADRDTVTFVDDPDQYRDVSRDAQIVGVVASEGCIASYDIAHPSTDSLRAFIAEQTGKDGMPYAFSLSAESPGLVESRPDFLQPVNSKKLAAYCAVLALAPVGFGKVEAAITKTQPNTKADVLYSALFVLGALGLAGLKRYVGYRLEKADKKAEHEVASYFQDKLDQKTMPR